MAVFRNATVNEVWDLSLGQGSWNLRFSRDSNDWELDLIEELLLLLRDFRISSEEDSVLWKRGGLGIRKIVLLNKALLGKWIWRFAFEKDLLWKKVIEVKYGQEGCGWRTNETHGTFGVGVWKEILKEANWCWDNIGFKVGEGTKVKFWMMWQHGAVPKFTPIICLGGP